MTERLRVLFVDDELKILQALRRMLRGMRHEWDMAFVESGEAALALLEDAPYNVIVSDMRMPRMSGSVLLEIVRERYPEMVRIILSGHADKAMILKAVTPVHQFLSKPCSSDTLVNTVTRAYQIRRLIHSPEVRRVVSKVSTLPSLPDLYRQIMEELGEAEPSMHRIATIIDQDIGMSAKILQLVNSAFFGLPRHVATPFEAVNLLGIETIRALALSLQIFTEFEGLEDEAVLSRLWAHSMAVGQAGKWLAVKMGADRFTVDHAYQSGLLHDVGKLILMANFPEKYRLVLRRAARGEQQLDSVETDILGVSHAKVGAYLLGIWGLPDPIIEAVAYHHMPLAQGLDPGICVISTHLGHYLSCIGENGAAELCNAGVSQALIEQPFIEGRWADWKKGWIQKLREGGKK